MKKLIVFVGLFCLRATIGFKLELPVCKLSSPDLDECLKQSFQEQVRVIARGEPALDIKSVEPFLVESLEIQNGGDGPVTMRQRYDHLVMHGISNGTILNGHVKPVSPTEIIVDIVALIPHSLVEADYKIDGKVLLLPIHGEGKCNFTFHNAKLIYTIYYEKYQKKGKDYLRVTKVPFQLEPERIEFYLSNLFDGNEQLAKQMLLVLNENWHSVYHELKKPFEEVVGKLFLNFLNHFYSKVPMEWFLVP